MRAFLTGSQAYGTANAKSDVDLVIVVDTPTKEKLIELSDLGKMPIRFGNLNLVVVQDEDAYKAWKAATKKCQSIVEQCGTITKKKAVEIHEQTREEMGVAPYDHESSNPEARAEARAARRDR